MRYLNGEFQEELTYYDMESPRFQKSMLSRYGQMVLNILADIGLHKELRPFRQDKGLLMALLADMYENIPVIKKDKPSDLNITQKLLQYIKKHFQNILQSGGLLPLVAFNYARELVLVEHYEQAIEIGQLGWQSCTQYGQYRMLAPTIALIAECNHFLGDDSKSKEYYRQSYYIYKAVDDERGARVITAEAKKYFGEDFSF